MAAIKEAMDKIDYMLIGEQELQRAKELVRFAEDRKNWWTADDVGLDSDHRYTMMFGTIKVIFSFSILKGKAYRHMTAFVKDGLPPPPAVFTIAHVLGFGGEPDDKRLVQEPDPSWIINVHDCGMEECQKSVSIAQPIITDIRSLN